MTHADYMKKALQLAARGRTSPNPMVGAIIVKDGEIVGQGYHRRAGEPHAEVLALRQAGERARGGILYVTLEPCCHYGRTPPCTKALIKAGISEVYAAMADPDPHVAGKGFSELVEAGIRVHYPLLEEEARQLNEAYIKHRTTGLPLVTLKSALSLDGRIATHTGESKWLTSERSRGFAHRVRSRVDAIVVGARTVRADNPRLTARVGRKVFYPRRVVVTKSGNLPRDLAVFTEPGECIVACPQEFTQEAREFWATAGARVLALPSVGGRVSMAALMRELAAMGCLSVLIEGGGETAAAALEERIVDKVLFFYAPKIIGGRGAVPAVGGVGAARIDCAPSLQDLRIRRIDNDILVEGRVVYPESD
ncbi:MAG: bifunctional diaminohydroxyphosphoribosylaminopyrimidine deaminase/5-amino-6-(5-phosphoribosylamino)uracil reductase RibD [Armatimonadota bacterium]|nr:bifunctional diaminohydroxyphosphoribosylaminopyrimidine deaminase/5-amino-6-(5-phosphoribosylamino)uracil reductase RibD [Armatimonadota bacterium]